MTHPGPSLDGEVTRRRFLSRGSCALAALSGIVGCASVMVRQVRPTDGLLELPLGQYPELEQPGGALRVQIPGDSTMVYILANGSRQFVAVSPVCTHLGCTVELHDTQLVCPCHGSAFDRSGAVVRGPAERPLRRYRTTVTSGDVLQIQLAGGASDA